MIINLIGYQNFNKWLTFNEKNFNDKFKKSF